MEKRIPQSESFLFIRKADSGRIMTLRLRINHDQQTITMDNADGCGFVASGTQEEVEVWSGMIEKARIFAAMRMAEAKKLTIDEP